MEVHGITDSMDFHAAIETPMDFYGLLWSYKDSYGIVTAVLTYSEGLKCLVLGLAFDLVLLEIGFQVEVLLKQAVIATHY